MDQQNQHSYRACLWPFVIIAMLCGALWYTGFPRLLAKSACDQTIHYRIGSIDPLFDKTAEKFKADLINAESVWEKPSGKELFVYDPAGRLTVNFIYDERQTLSNEVETLVKSAESGEQSYQSQVQKYQELVTQYEQKLSAYNKDVAYWNSHGGAPPAEYTRLEQERQDLVAMQATLSKLASKVNVTVKQYNQTVGELNQTSSQYQKTRSSKPEEGIYAESEHKIDIYHYSNEDELVHTIAHEFGHALGLDHLNDQDAIMFANTSESTEATETDIVALNRLCSASLADRVAENTRKLILNLRQQ